MKFLLTAVFLLAVLTTQAQHLFKATVQDSTTHEALIGVAMLLKGTATGASTDATGQVSLSNIPAGRHTLVFSFIGYHTREITLDFPLADTQPLVVLLAAEASDLEEVTVSATRTNSRIEDLPVKVEVLGIEDMEEENSIKPASIASILGDLSVIHIQQTSAVNGSSVIRMQGLDGKYTQLLRDGLPLYEGFSGSFGVIQIPPLDLKQIEIIKGSVSTLYGGGAIAGMINVVSKTPTPERNLSFTLNQTTLTETNLNGYYSQKFGKFGVTSFLGYTRENAVDVNGDGFSDLPEIKHLLFHPKFFYDFSEKTKADLGFSYLTETRTGGDVSAINDGATNQHPYFQKNDNQRFTTDFQVVHSFKKDHRLTAKGTFSQFDRKLTQRNFGFTGKQVSGYGEVSDFLKTSQMEWVFGANLTIENFHKTQPDSTLIQDFNYQTVGLFLQNGWHLTDKFLIETGLRTDFHNVFGTFVLPRIAFFYKPTKDFSVRLSSGAGYKTPNIFTSQSVSTNLRTLLPVTPDLKSEHSVGINFDLNYNFTIGESITATLNQAFYFTGINDPLVLRDNGSGFIGLSNSSQQIRSLGTDTYLRFEYKHLELYLGYNHTIAKRTGNGNDVYVAFSPQDKFSSTVAYEIEGKWRFGIENSWIANQYATPIGSNYELFNLRKVRNYWFWAGTIERKFGPKVSLVLNSENIFDFRQSQSEILFTGSQQTPSFVNLWGPIDGRITNLALRLKL